MTGIRRLLVGVALASALLVAPVAAASTGPGLTGSISNDPNLAGATSVAIFGHYAYTTAYQAGELTAVDFSNPANPVVTGSSAFSTGLMDSTNVYIAGGFAYVVSKNRNGPCLPGPIPMCGSGTNDDGTGNSLTILDISTNPAVPRIVGSVRDPTKLFGGYGVAVSGHYAFVAAQGCVGGQPCPNSVGNSFEVVDVTNPAAPAIVASLRNSALPAPFAGTNALDHATSVAISGHYAYVTAAYSSRLTIIDIAHPLAPVIVASLLDSTQLDFPVDLVVRGNYAYVANQDSAGRVAVVDVSNPASPKIVATVTDPATLNGGYRIRLSGNFAYVSAVSVASVTAIDISDPLAPREVGHVTDSTHLNKTTGLEVDPTAKYVVAASPYLNGQGGTGFPPFAPGTGTISVLTLDPVPIGVSISAQPTNPTTQTTASFTFSPTDSISSVLCSLDGAPLGPCSTATTAQYSGLASGSHTFTVQAADAAGAVASASYAWTIGQGPVNTKLPTVSGAVIPLSTLTASPGTWTGSPTFTYQWSACDLTGANCNPIPGETFSTYVVRIGDVSSTLEVTVTGTNSAGSASATSLPTGLVAVPPANIFPPAISGFAVAGQTLTAGNGTWLGTPPPAFTYQWLDCDTNGANCAAILSATSSTYNVQGSDAGSTIAVTVTATNGAGSASATSVPTAVVSSSPAPPVLTARPSISGPASPVTGDQLTGSSGTWTGTPAPTYTYQWSKCDSAGINCSFISSATSPSYTVRGSDVGSTLRVTVTATNGVGVASARSAATAVVAAATNAPLVNTAPPSISGPASPVAGNPLTASPGTWTGSPAPTYTYVWSRCNVSGGSCIAISPATSSPTYTVQGGDVGFRLEVTVTAANVVGAASAVSGLTAVVTATTAPPVNTALPSISGKAAQGQRLTAVNGTWTGTPAPTFGYQWVRCAASGFPCSVISSATGPSYKLAVADVGSTIRAFVIATNSSGLVRAISPATGLVKAVHHSPPLRPVITHLRETAKTWRVGSQPARASAGKPKAKPLPTGTKFSLTLNVPASLSFSFTMKRNGRKVGGRCRTQTSQSRHQPRCTLKLAAGTLVLAAEKGVNKVSFAGRLAHGKKLRPGAYTVAIIAIASGQRSKTATLSFTIVP